MKIKTTRSLKDATDTINPAMNKRLTFGDQFNSFLAVVTAATGEEARVTNRLRDVGGRPVKPGSFLVVDASGAGTGAIGRGPTAWTESHLYVKNYGATDGVFHVRFFEKEQQDPRLT